MSKLAGVNWMRLRTTEPYTDIPHTFGSGCFHYHCFFSYTELAHRCLKNVIRGSVLGREKVKKELYQPCLFSFRFHAAFIGEPLEKESGVQ